MLAPDAATQLAAVAVGPTGDAVADNLTNAPQGWPHGRSKPRGLSPSSINAYLECERRWAYEKLEKLPTVSHPAAVAGTHVHRVLELLMDLPPHRRTLETARAIHTGLLAELGAALNRVATDGLDAVVASLQGDRPDIEHLRGVVVDFIGCGATRREFFDLTTAGVEGYFRIAKADPTKVKVYATERKFQGRLPTSSGDVPVTAIIDRIDHLPEQFGGGLRVVDYKNGSLPKPRFDDGSGYRRQILIYGAVVEEFLGTLPRSGLLIYTREATPKPVAITREGVDEAKDQVGTIWADINAKFPTFGYEPNASILCGWCPFVSICDEGEAKVREVAAAGKLKETAPAWDSLAPLEGTPKPAR